MHIWKRAAACIAAGLLFASSASAETTLHITFAGDCTLGSEEAMRNQASSFVSTITREGYDWPFANMQELFQNDDLTVVNLEGVLSDSNKQENKKKTFRFRGPTDYVNILTRSGIEAVNLANNHTQDFGKQGFTSTQQTLDAAGIAQVRQWAQTVVECPYPLLERVKLEIAAAQGILGEVSYGAQVRLPALLPVEHWPAYAARITELTAGKIAAEKLGETFQAAPVEAR